MSWFEEGDEDRYGKDIGYSQFEKSKLIFDVSLKENQGDF